MVQSPSIKQHIQLDFYRRMPRELFLFDEKLVQGVDLKRMDRSNSKDEAKACTNTKMAKNHILGADL